MEDGFDLKVGLRGDLAIVTVTGELDPYGSQEFPDCLEGLVAFGYAVVIIDLSGVTYIDSGGLDALVRANKRAQAAGARLIVLKPSAGVNRVLDITGVSTMVAVLA